MQYSRVPGFDRRAAVTIFVNGHPVNAFLGESVHAALLAAGIRVFRKTPKRGHARGIFCGMGVCYDCLVKIDGRPNQRACMELVADGMRIETDES